MITVTYSQFDIIQTGSPISELTYAPTPSNTDLLGYSHYDGSSWSSVSMEFQDLLSNISSDSNNGLTNSGSITQLGGNLINLNTTIDLNGNTFSFIDNTGTGYFNIITGQIVSESVGLNLINSGSDIQLSATNSITLSSGVNDTFPIGTAQLNLDTHIEISGGTYSSIDVIVGTTSISTRQFNLFGYTQSIGIFDTITPNTNTIHSGQYGMAIGSGNVLIYNEYGGTYNYMGLFGGGGIQLNSGYTNYITITQSQIQITTNNLNINGSNAVSGTMIIGTYSLTFVQGILTNF